MQAVVLFGSPGSGKGTQAKLLKDRLQIPHISTGDMLRQHIQAGDSLGSRVAARIHAGGLVNDGVMEQLVEERLVQPDASHGFILDGYPRTLDQAEHLSRWLDARGIREVVIHLVVDYNSSVARLTGRRQCPRCGTLYNTLSNPPRVAGVCDLDGEKLVIRDDDQESVIRERLEAYEKQTKPLIEYFRQGGRNLREIDAENRTPEEVAEQVCLAIGGSEAGLPVMQA